MPASASTGSSNEFRDSQSPSVSADGRYVAFTTSDRLVPEDNPNDVDAYVHDRQTGGIQRVSVDSSAVPANGPSSDTAISGDGRVVAFVSIASNLVAGDTNAGLDVFTHDRQTAETRRVSIPPPARRPTA